MALDSSFAICLLVMLSAVSAVMGIQCYQCNSYEHPECADINPNSTESQKFLGKCEERNDQKMFCRKVVQSIIDTPNFVRTTRSCGWLPYKTNDSSCQVADSDFKLETSCQCFSDGCNSGTVLKPIVGILMLAFAALFFS